MFKIGYTSDARLKAKMKECDSEANLKNLRLRVFGESRQDQNHWTRGGLTFGPKSCLFGSNDAGWFLAKSFSINEEKISNQTPVLLVEGSYGTETGNSGSAQFARFSHALGAVIDGFIGVYFIPFESQYIKKNGKEVTVKVRPHMIKAALNACEMERGEYLFIDAYKPELLVELLRALDGGDGINKKSILLKIKLEMRDYVDQHDLDIDRSNYLYSGECMGKLFMFNSKAFEDSRYRNGHTILGDALINHYWHKKPFDLIFPRLTHDDCKRLDSSNKKEWTLLRTYYRDIQVITLDDIEFDDNTLKKELYAFRNVSPLLGKDLQKKNKFVKLIVKGFSSKNIRIDWNRVEKNKHK